jgi:hypothetical protein
MILPPYFIIVLISFMPFITAKSEVQGARSFFILDAAAINC